jgi:hypothetical protein
MKNTATADQAQKIMIAAKLNSDNSPFAIEPNGKCGTWWNVVDRKNNRVVDIFTKPEALQLCMNLNAKALASK